MWRQGALGHSWGVGGKWVQPLWKTVLRFLKTLRVELPNESAIPLLGVYPAACTRQCVKLAAPQGALHRNSQEPSYRSNLRRKCPSTDKQVERRHRDAVGSGSAVTR